MRRPRPLSARVRAACIARWGVAWGDELLFAARYDRRRQAVAVRSVSTNGEEQRVMLSLVADDDDEAMPPPPQPQEPHEERAPRLVR